MIGRITSLKLYIAWSTVNHSGSFPKKTTCTSWSTAAFGNQEPDIFCYLKVPVALNFLMKAPSLLFDYSHENIDRSPNLLHLKETSYQQRNYVFRASHHLHQSYNQHTVPTAIASATKISVLLGNFSLILRKVPSFVYPSYFRFSPSAAWKSTCEVKGALTFKCDALSLQITHFCLTFFVYIKCEKAIVQCQNDRDHGWDEST